MATAEQVLVYLVMVPAIIVGIRRGFKQAREKHQVIVQATQPKQRRPGRGVLNDQDLAEMDEYFASNGNGSKASDYA